ncbi:MAG: 4'-phosphopantetheinyl transferase superfamily protein [Anaerolineales bacterium]
MNNTTWIHPPENLDLAIDRVDVWRIHLGLTTPSEDSLSADERQRASRFHFDTDCDRYVASHASLRDVLSRYLQCEPHDLKFSANEYGKPFLDRSNDFSRSKNIEFNLSHSGDFALIAVTRGRKVGVDVEHIRADIELEDLARRNFSPREVSELMSLPLEQRARGFFNCWTRKEAYIKAQGLGLSMPLDSFDVSLGEPAALNATRPDENESARWSLHSLNVESNYAAALAVEGNGLEIRCWDWVVDR